MDSPLDLVVRARLALEDQCPTLALEGVPTLVGRPQVLEGSLATGSLTANLTGHQFLINPKITLCSGWDTLKCAKKILDRMKSMRFCSCRQCQGTPGRCVDPCTNNVETGLNQHSRTSARSFPRKEHYIPVLTRVDMMI